MNVSLIIPAFIAGLLTFLAPCTLPLVPGFLGFIGGASLGNIAQKEDVSKIKKRVIKNAFLYVIGFSIVFISLGTVFGAAGLGLAKYRLVLSRVGGAVVIVFGLYMMHILKIPALNFLNAEHSFNIVAKLKPGRAWSSFLLGATFAFGWTPCVGPVLGAILTLALTTGTIGQGIFLLSVFSVGLALPFLLVAFAFGSATKYIHKITKYLNIISFVGGLFLVFIGVLLVTDSITVWNSFAYRLLDFINYTTILDYL